MEIFEKSTAKFNTSMKNAFKQHPYTLAVISEVANLILVSAYDKYLSFLRVKN